MDNEGILHEAILNENNEVIVFTPPGEDSPSVAVDEKEDLDKEEEKIKEDEMSQMFSNELVQEESTEYSMEKPKQLIYRKNDGYVSITAFMVISAFLLVSAIVYAVLS